MMAAANANDVRVTLIILVIATIIDVALIIYHVRKHAAEKLWDDDEYEDDDISFGDDDDPWEVWD